MNAIHGWLDRLLKAAISVLLAAMVINVVWQVFTRFVLKSPSSVTEEMARYSMIWLGLLGAAYSSGRKSHLALDLLTLKLQGPRRRLLELFIQGCLLAFALVVMVGEVAAREREHPRGGSVDAWVGVLQVIVVRGGQRRQHVLVHGA